jgi:hypothetical protein
MALLRIRLELARTAEFPEGSNRHGYEFVAPLNGDGHLDQADWQAHRQDCRVRRFWAGDTDEHGHLVHRGKGWAFHYEDTDEEDEPIFRFDLHRFAEGEYVSITEHDGEQRTFRVVSVRPVD